MQRFPAGAPAQAGGLAAVSDVLIGTVLQAAALVVVAGGYPGGTPPSEGGGATPLDEAAPEPPLLEPALPDELPKPPEPDAEDDRDPEDVPVPDDDVAAPDELLLLLGPGSKQNPFWQTAVLLYWQSLSLVHACC